MRLSRDATHAVELGGDVVAYVAHFSEAECLALGESAKAAGWRWCREGVPFGTAFLEKWRGPYSTPRQAISAAKEGH